MSQTLYMLIEHFKDGNAERVYRRFSTCGRMAPDGLNYVASWVDDTLTTCYQVMQTADRQLLEEWMGRWNDIIDFEVHVVTTSAEAARRLAPKP